MWTQDPVNMSVDNAEDLMDFVKNALNAAMEPVLLLTKKENEDEYVLEEINEYIDGKEELDKWRANKQD